MHHTNKKKQLWPISWMCFAMPFSLFPLFLWHRSFSALFWFGDEWDLLDQISRQGIFNWTIQLFAENFVPFFKILWGSLLIFGGGSYIIMILAVWITHLLVVLFFGLLLRFHSFSLFSTMTCMGLLGLSACNIETLAWSVQWASVLSALFFLVGLWILARRLGLDQPLTWQERFIVFGLSSASALCLSRGVLSGVAYALFLCLQPLTSLRKTPLKRICDLVCCLLPGILVALVIVRSASGNLSRGLKINQIFSSIEFAVTYLTVNPYWRVLNFDIAGWNSSVWCAAGLKSAIETTAIILAPSTQRRFLWILLASDIGNAMMLGIGRYHTGVIAACSSRYQYFSLICSLPFLAVLLSWICTLQVARQKQLLPLKAISAALLCIVTMWQWPEHVKWFANWRGRATRDQLLSDSASKAIECSLPGIPFLPLKRGVELAKQFQLH